MSQEIINDEPEPDAAKRLSFLSRIRGRLPGLSTLRALNGSEDRAELATLDDLEGHFALMAVPLEGEAIDGDALERGVDSLRNNGVIRSNTVVEARLLMPETELRHQTIEKGLEAMGIVKAELDD